VGNYVKHSLLCVCIFALLRLEKMCNNYVLSVNVASLSSAQIVVQ
jgi:hypothetical protein